MEYMVAIFALVIGVSAVVVSWKLVNLYFKIGSWKIVDAKVVSKEVVFNNLLNSPKTPYTILIEYIYQPDNTELRGNKLDLVELIGGYSAYRKVDAEKRMNKIKQHIKVYVNPKDQSQSIVNRNGVLLYLLVFVMGIMAIFFGVAKLFINLAILEL